ncbi:MAG TPA: hypothetical protein VFQ45_18225 [Longimicrobium sp.]|nr:hypothetical protein [Longimicrobium sp.]
MGTRTTPLVKAVLLSLMMAAGLAACRDRGDETDIAESPAVEGVIIPQRLAYAEFPVDSATILRWVQATDTVSIRRHAWNIWVGLTAMTNQVANGDTLPVYETWLSRYEVYNVGIPLADRRAFATRGRPVDRGFHSPVQFHHPASVGLTGTSAGQDERVIAGVKYNMASAGHVWRYNYTDSTTLDSLNNAWPTSTPIADRNIVPFPDSAIATKPVYWIVNQTGLTVMPYWAGVDSSTNPGQPTDTTWTQFVAIDPTGQQVGDTVQVQEHGRTYPARVIGLDQFYSFPLTQDEVNDITNPTNNPALDTEIANDSIDVYADGRQSQQPVSVGDYAVLTAMHVSTKEIGNWTWQTFWWTPDYRNNPLASDQPAGVQGPFKNFAMQQAYYMVIPSGPSQGQNQVTFNPYLETGLTPPDSGIASNCMSCHRMATWTFSNYHFYGNIQPGDSALFAGFTKLDFLWSVQVGASTAQASLLRRSRAGSSAPPAGQTTGTPPGTPAPAPPGGTRR